MGDQTLADFLKWQSGVAECFSKAVLIVLFFKLLFIFGCVGPRCRCGLLTAVVSLDAEYGRGMWAQ